MRLSTICEKKGHCPSCGKKFKKDEPYPDVENCEVCERFGSPVKESYEGLEDADEFGGGCSICGDISHAFTCPNCNDEICDSCYQDPENAHCVDCGSTICTGCDTREDPNAGMICDPCWDRQQERSIEQAYEDAWESNQSDLYEDAMGLRESYEGLEDADEFGENPWDHGGYDPIWNEFQYRFLGSRSGHEFSFRGHTYRVGDRWSNDVYQDGELIGKTRDEVPESFGPSFEWNSVGEFLPAQMMTWAELVEQLYNMYGPDDYGDPPPGVGV
jgi:hypothetical protein